MTWEYLVDLIEVFNNKIDTDAKNIASEEDRVYMLAERI